LAAAQDGYNYDSPARSFSHRAASSESSEEGYNYEAPVRIFKPRAPKNTYVAPTRVVARPVVKYVAPVEVSSEEDGYDYQQPARTFTHQPKKTYVAPTRAPARPRNTYVPPKPKNTYVAPKPVATYVAPVRVVAKPVVKYVAPVDVSSEEDGYDYQQPARTFTHSAPRPKNTYVAPKPKNTYVAPKPKNTYVAPKPQNTYVAPKPKNTYQAPANTYKAPESDEVLDYAPTNPEYRHAYEVADDETGADFHQEEERDGDQTQGSYSVALPDGRTQTVTYYVNGDGGFVAEVTYEGEAQYPPEPEGGYGPWTGPIAGAPHIVRGEYSTPTRTYITPDSSEEVETPRGLYSAPRA